MIQGFRQEIDGQSLLLIINDQSIKICLRFLMEPENNQNYAVGVALRSFPWSPNCLNVEEHKRLEFLSFRRFRKYLTRRINNMISCTLQHPYHPTVTLLKDL